jgi:sugar lactone lactonase YvrE
MMRRLLVPLLVVSALPATVAAQNPLARMPEVRRAINAGNAAAALALLDSLRLVAPDHPNVVFLGAHANGLAGRRGEARAELVRLLRWDARFARAALRDTNVAVLRSEFADVDSLARLAERQVSLGSVWATIAERDLVPEGTAWDGATRSVLVGSLNKYKIVAIGPDGSMSDRVAPGAGGLRSVVGIHVDSARGILWAASNRRYDTPADSTPSALFAFDARTGAFKSRLAAPGLGRHFLNDVTTGPDGTVYVTDTEAGRVWHAPPGATELRELTALGRVLAPNGITISTDGRVLFVADADHIRAFEIRSGSTWRLATPDSVNVASIDGLAFADGALIAHHPLAFWRIARYPLDPTWRRIEGRLLLEANTPDGRTSTTGEVVGDNYVYIGNSQIDRMNARTTDAATMEPIRIYRVRLPGRAGGAR